MGSLDFLDGQRLAKMGGTDGGMTAGGFVWCWMYHL